MPVLTQATLEQIGCSVVGEAVAEVEGIEAVEMEAYLGEAEAVLRE